MLSTKRLQRPQVLASMEMQCVDEEGFRMLKVVSKEAGVMSHSTCFAMCKRYLQLGDCTIILRKLNVVRKRKMSEVLWPDANSFLSEETVWPVAVTKTNNKSISSTPSGGLLDSIRRGFLATFPDAVSKRKRSETDLVSESDEDSNDARDASLLKVIFELLLCRHRPL